jgi:hypothetical protein
MSFILTRQQFYDVLWSAPLKELRPVLGVTDLVTLRSARKGNIPMPDPTRWLKRNAGKNLKRPTLPDADLVTPTVFYFKGELTPEFQSLFDGEPGEEGPEEPIEVLAARLQARIGSLPVYGRSRKLHTMILRMQERDQKRRYGGHIYTTATGLRALRVASALFTLAEALGCRPDTRANYDYFDFSLDVGPIDWLRIFVDNQRDQLTVGPAEEWAARESKILKFRDDEDHRIEDRLEEIFAAYAEQGERIRRQWREEMARRDAADAERERQEQIRRQLEAEQAERQRREDERVARINSAVAEASSWRDARLLRDYSEAYLSAHNGDEAITHAKWLRDVADEIDPLLKDGPDVSP